MNTSKAEYTQIQICECTLYASVAVPARSWALLPYQIQVNSPRIHRAFTACTHILTHSIHIQCVFTRTLQHIHRIRRIHRAFTANSPHAHTFSHIQCVFPRTLQHIHRIHRAFTAHSPRIHRAFTACTHILTHSMRIPSHSAQMTLR